MTKVLEQPATIVRDPVCGMEIDRSAAVTKRTTDDTTLYFCSYKCAVAFDRSRSGKSAVSRDVMLGEGGLAPKVAR